MQTQDAIRSLAKQGWKIRRIGKELGISPNTVRQYVRSAEEATQPKEPTNPGDGPVQIEPHSRDRQIDPLSTTGKIERKNLCENYDVLKRRAYRPLAPLNLRVAGDGYNPTYPTGGDIIGDWDKSWHRSAVSPVTQVLTTDIDKTVLEVWTMADVLAGTFEFTGGTGPKAITNAQLVATLGSETDFNPPSSCARCRGRTTAGRAAGLLRPQRLPESQLR